MGVVGGDMQVSVILTSWKRFINLENIIKVWLEEPQVDEIILWDNSGNFKTELPIITINSNCNFGASARYALASLAKNDIIIFCDDDILPQQNITSDFLKYFKENKILGITGRLFKGSYHNNEVINANGIENEIKVNFLIGYLTMIHKKHLLGFDYSKFPWHCCELYLEGLLKDKIDLFVIPTVNYKELPESQDENALCKQPIAGKEKEEIWSKFFR